MAKRKQPDPSPEVGETPSKRRRRTTSTRQISANGGHDENYESDAIALTKASTPKKQQTPSKARRKSGADALLDEEEQLEGGSPTPKANGRTLFSTPRRAKPRAAVETPSKPTLSKSKADRSAKRKSARALVETQEGDGWDGELALAKEILGADEDEEEEHATNEERDVVEQAVEADDAGTTTPSKTPGRRGRPKGAKNKRSPTPDGDIAPEERFFFQNRAGPPQISSNKFTSVKLLNHEEYFEQIQRRNDHHDGDMAQLMKLHARSFVQWLFELDQGFGLCLYGYGSKRGLTNAFAEWLYGQKRQQKHRLVNTASTAASSPVFPPHIIVVNGYTPKLNVRAILTTIATAISNAPDNNDDCNDEREEDEEIHQPHKHRHKPIRLVGQPHEMLDTLLANLTTRYPASLGGSDGERKGNGEQEIVLVINSIDAPPLRRSSAQSVLARLAEHPQIKFIATADTPTFSNLWNSTLLDQFQFVFHDCTTFAPYTAELSVVDEVHELLGRKRLRAGGKEGIGFVLKSLPDNARNLYRLLICEVLTMLSDEGGVATNGTANMVNHQDDDHAGEYDLDENRQAPQNTRFAKLASTRPETADQVGIEYRTLYQKASEEFICSSSMNFQFLLKEFHDHQMITSRRDASGTEVLGIPLDRSEMEAVLEELVI